MVAGCTLSLANGGGSVEPGGRKHHRRSVTDNKSLNFCKLLFLIATRKFRLIQRQKRLRNFNKKQPFFISFPQCTRSSSKMANVPNASSIETMRAEEGKARFLRKQRVFKSSGFFSLS